MKKSRLQKVFAGLLAAALAIGFSFPFSTAIAADTGEAEINETAVTADESGEEAGAAGLISFEAETDHLYIQITAAAGDFPEGAKLKAEEIPVQDAAAVLKETAAEGADVADAKGVDLTFWYEGEEIQPAGGETVSVVLKLKEALKAPENSSILIVHEHADREGGENGRTVLSDTESSCDQICFNVASFSKFYVGTVADLQRAALLDGTLYGTLQEAVDAAADNEASTIIIVSDIFLSQTVRIPSGKHIILSDDGVSRTIAGDGTNNAAPLFTVAAGGSLTFDATSSELLILEGGSASGTATLVRSSGTLNLVSATLEGGKINGSGASAIRADSGSIFNMSGGILENTVGTSDYGAAVVIDSGAQFNLSGGAIADNHNSGTATFAAGGVLLSNWNSTEPETVMNMTGGSISGNSGANGGGVSMAGRATFRLTGGEISGNEAAGQGGGVCVTGVDASYPYTDYTLNRFIMDGGRISYNSARNGGGIYVNSDAVYLNAGYIENNTARANPYNQWSGHGGGVYVSEVPRVLHVNDAVVTENTAVAAVGFGGTSGMGGGLWACPTGSIDLKVTNGIAVYNNHAVGNDTAGDDVVKVKSVSGEGATMTLADRMLGGGAVKWYADGGVLYSTVGYVDDSVPRYDPAHPGEELHFDHVNENIALKAVVSEAAVRRALEEAKLYIRYNEANHGGGIGTNGDVTLADYDTPDWKLKVTKKWEGVAAPDREEVEVFLKIGDEILDSVLLNNDNGWAAEFTQLPAPDSLSAQEISVVEGTLQQNDDGTTTFKETTTYLAVCSLEAVPSEYTIYAAVTNSKAPSDEYVSVHVSKEWNDQAPEHAAVTVYLLADGKREEGKQLVLNTGNSWEGTFSELPKYSGGREIAYSVEEEEVSGYKAAYTINGIGTKTYWVMVDAPEELEAGRKYVIAVQDWAQEGQGNPDVYYFMSDAGGTVGLNGIDAGEVFRGIYHDPPEPPLQIGKEYDEYLKAEYSDSMPESQIWFLSGQEGSWKLQNEATGNKLTLKGENWSPWSKGYSFITSTKDGWYPEENGYQGVNYSNTLEITDANDRMARISSTQTWGWPTPQQPAQYISLQNGSLPVATWNPEWAAQFKFFTPVYETAYECVITNTPSGPDNVPKTGDSTDIFLPLLLMAVSCAALAMLFLRNGKPRRRGK